MHHVRPFYAAVAFVLIFTTGPTLAGAEPGTAASGDDPTPSLVEQTWRVDNAAEDERIAAVGLRPRTISGQSLARAALVRSAGLYESGGAADTTRSYKNPALAFTLSFSATVLPAGVGLISASEGNGGLGVLGIWLGGLIGPSIGHFYARDTQGWWGLVIRGASTAVFITTAFWALEDDFYSDTSDDEGGEDAVQGILLFGSMIAFAGSALFDLATAHTSAQDYNEEHGLSAQVRPTYDPVTDGTGLTVRVQF
jgi:hypothetical protein